MAISDQDSPILCPLCCNQLIDGSCVSVSNHCQSFMTAANGETAPVVLSHVGKVLLNLNEQTCLALLSRAFLYDIITDEKRVMQKKTGHFLEDGSLTGAPNQLLDLIMASCFCHCKS
ncbi:hypothetical protein NE237_029331 [Protea cynaroides]|uniref:Uncharacterized protein n=1 Tax=Protea cynaroides TaxID=273540 RepID=A0A9Q0GS02_9MAGN|nr:hypothetical protein NE237_029331 [Protea cynaroides]